MRKTVVGTFDSREDAEQVAALLIERGFDRNDIDLRSTSATTGTSSHDHWHLLQDRDDQASVDVPVGHRPIHESTYRDAADEHVLAHDRVVNDHVAMPRLLRHSHTTDRDATSIHLQPLRDDRQDMTSSAPRPLIPHRRNFLHQEGVSD